MWKEVGKIRGNVGHRGVWIRLSWWPSPSNQSVAGKLAHLLEWFPSKIFSCFSDLGMWSEHGELKTQRKTSLESRGNYNGKQFQRISVGLETIRGWVSVPAEERTEAGPSTEGPSRFAGQGWAGYLLPCCLSQLPTRRAPCAQGDRQPQVPRGMVPRGWSQAFLARANH